jgi:MoxR-like ATPase
MANYRNLSDENSNDISVAVKFAHDLHENLKKVLYGASSAIDVSIVAVLSGQHLLIEDTPGVGKTILAKAIANSLGVSWTRIQGQPDLLPSDITGLSIYNTAEKSWEFKKGPIFSQVVLCDELNRTPPRTQAALLECMEEKQVTQDGTTYLLPDPHLVIATQNPVSQFGTFPLVESQTDRFGLSTSIGYPDKDEEIKLAAIQGTEGEVSKLEPISSRDHWKSVQKIAAELAISQSVIQYAVEICRATRELPGVILGISPRGAISLIRSAKAYALLRQRDFVTPDDVRDIVVYSLAHRLISESVMPAADLVIKAVNMVTAPRP